MDLSKFGINSPGQLVKGLGGVDSFVPNSLPPQWTFPERLWPKLVEANRQLYLLEGIGRNLPDPGILLRPIQDREAIKSSKIEGTHATAKELLLFEMEPWEPNAQDTKGQDWKEVSNYRKALEHGTKSHLPLSLRLINQLHAILMTGVRGKDKTPGQFRKIQVAMGENHRFVPPPPGKLMECLDPFEKFMNVPPTHDPLIHCFLSHYQFETIHPYADGNGRVGRLLLAIMLQRLCKLKMAWLYLSEYFEKHRDDYIKRLFEVSTEAKWGEWVEFCIDATIDQAQNTIARCDRLIALRKKYLETFPEVGGSIRLHQIVEGLFTHPFIRIVSLAKVLGVSYPTAKADVERLTQVGILKELKNVSPKTYYAPELFKIAYAGVTSSN